MIYPYAVKHDGKWYRPYEEVPEPEKDSAVLIEEEPKAIEEVEPAAEETETVESAPVETVRKRGRKSK